MDVKTSHAGRRRAERKSRYVPVGRLDDYALVDACVLLDEHARGVDGDAAVMADVVAEVDVDAAVARDDPFQRQGVVLPIDAHEPVVVLHGEGLEKASPVVAGDVPLHVCSSCKRRAPCSLDRWRTTP